MKLLKLKNYAQWELANFWILDLHEVCMFTNWEMRRSICFVDKTIFGSIRRNGLFHKKKMNFTIYILNFVNPVDNDFMKNKPQFFPINQVVIEKKNINTNKTSWLKILENEKFFFLSCLKNLVGASLSAKYFLLNIA